MKEIWKDIRDFEGYYQVSSFGNIRSCDRYVETLIHGKLIPRFHRGRTIKSCKNNKHYLTVGLHKKGKTNKKLVHRLVAETFIPNPNNLPEVNHIDENKANCRVDNLHWCTRFYNNNYGIQSKEGRRKTSAFRMKKVAKYDLDGNLIKIYDGIRIAADANNINNRNIVTCCKSNESMIGFKKDCHTMGGYIWRYMKEGDE